MEPYVQMLKIAQTVRCSIPQTSVELEVRMPLPEVLDWEPEERLSLQYYRCAQHPYLTIRRRGERGFETKELVSRLNVGPLRIACSIEKTYTRFPLPLLKHTTRHLERKVLSSSPYVTVTREQGLFTLEIEYDEATIDACYTWVRRLQLPLWPAPKPRDAHASELLSRLSEGWTLSRKLDGIHVMIYDDVAIDDGGRLYTRGSERSPPCPEAQFIAEGEWMGDQGWVIFDVLRSEGRDVTQLPYLERLALAVGDVKKVIPFHTYPELVLAAETIEKEASVANDGWILTHQGPYGEIVYKSKPLPTVDLQYIQGYLYLASETRSSRESPQVLEEGKIYEFDLRLNLLRERPDKLTPNTHLPVEIDPLSHILSGQGVPCLRYHHNAVKMYLLSQLPRTTLLDIGSGVGGDLSKWKELQFQRVLAIDRELQLRHRPSYVTTIRAPAEEVGLTLTYEAVSFFFVPWSDAFLPVFQRAQQVVLIVMDRPQSVETPLYQVKVEGGRVILKIPGTAMAERVEEPIPDLAHIDQAMASAGFHQRHPVLPLSFGSEAEKTLAAMYSYRHYFR